MKGAFSIEYDQNGHIIIDSIVRRYEEEADPTEMEAEAIAYIVDLTGDVDIQRRTDSYLTLCNDGGNDFCRLKITPRTMWFSVDVPEDLRNDPRLANVPNKNQRHWKIKLSCIDEIKDYLDIIEAASKIVY